MTDYFINFAPADAVQFQEGGPNENIALVCEWLGANPDEDYAYFDGEPETGLPGGGTIYYGTENEQVFPGQWLVRQGSRVWVQDEEPARVVRWETGRMSPGGDVWDHDWLSWWPEYRRPVLSNGWTGPWVPVAGGAE